MKSIDTLAWLYRIFGWSNIVYAVALPVFFGQTFSILTLLGIIQHLSWAIVSLVLARALLKKEKWAWYTALVLTAVSLTPVFFGDLTGFGLFLVIGLEVWILVLLLKGRRIFTEQPKEMFSQWLHKKSFMIVLVAGVISELIFLLNKVGLFENRF